jgi:transcriptional regulator with XRE-family HTH domain
VGGSKAVQQFSRTRLRDVRKQARLTQYALDQAAGLPHGTVAQYESVREPTVTALTKLAAALGVAPDDLRDAADQGEESLGDLRVQTGLTQAQFAHRAGLTRSTYATIERGEHGEPTAEQFARIAQVLTTDGLGVTAGDVQAAYDRARATHLEKADGY